MQINTVKSFRSSLGLYALGLGVLCLAGTAHASGILTSASSSYSYSGALTGDSGLTPAGTAESSFDVPVALNGQSLPFVQNTSVSDPWGYATSRYDLELNSVLYPDFDTLTMQLQIGVSGEVSGSWDTWSEWTNSLGGTLLTEFQLQQWARVDLDLSIAWSLVQQGSPLDGSAEPGVNVITIRGPLEAEPSTQTAYIFNKTLPMSPTWWLVTSAASNTSEYLVPGRYEVMIHSQMGSDGYRSSTDASAFGIDIGNNVSIAVTQNISPTACLAGVPCPATADLDGVGGVQINDFAAWYAAPIDVTSDGLVDSADVAALAWLTGLSTADADDDGVVDAVEAYLAAAPVGPPLMSAASVQLHTPQPNPFNPSTTLAFTLPAESAVDLSVFDLQGRHIRTLVAGEVRAAGRHEASWDGRDKAGTPAPAGVYVHRLRAGGDVVTGRMLLLK